MHFIQKTANYKIEDSPEGIRVSFFCAASGALLCCCAPVPAEDPEEAVRISWEQEGKAQFNLCSKCGNWVSDVMYNADVLECVACAPWEDMPNFCHRCGKRLSPSLRYCPRCGARLLHVGG